jgi:hypothetical protein
VNQADIFLPNHNPAITAANPMTTFITMLTIAIE